MEDFRDILNKDFLDFYVYLPYNRLAKEVDNFSDFAFIKEDLQNLRMIFNKINLQLSILEDEISYKGLDLDHDRRIETVLENIERWLEWTREILNKMIKKVYNVYHIRNANIIHWYLHKAYYIVVDMLKYTYAIRNSLRFGQDDSALLNKYIRIAREEFENVENLIKEFLKYI